MRHVIFIVAGIAVAVAPTATGAQVPPPPKIVIEDPVGDANFINDQGTSDGTLGDAVTPGDVSEVTDLEAIGFSNDAKNLYVTIDTETSPPATQGVGFRVRVNPDGPGGAYCLVFEAFYPGAGNDLTEAKGHVRDVCAASEAVPVQVLGSMIVVPRNSHEALGRGATLTAPQAQGFIYLGTYPAGVPAPTSDTTKVGKDYKLVDKKR